eukprot:4154182-Prymnesium_polylepis.1
MALAMASAPALLTLVLLRSSSSKCLPTGNSAKRLARTSTASSPSWGLKGRNNNCRRGAAPVARRQLMTSTPRAVNVLNISQNCVN